MISFKKYIYADLYRITGKKSSVLLIKQIFFGISFKYIFWMRLTRFSRKSTLLRFTLFPITKFFLNHYMFKFGISIPYQTEIGPGFYIGHFGGIVINRKTVIGKNCNISQSVTLGQANRGKNIGAPIIGDNVYIGPGAKVVGKVIIGNNVAIGANCVVTKDMPDNSVVVGIPGKVISDEGSIGYVNRIDYEKILGFD